MSGMPPEEFITNWPFQTILSWSYHAQYQIHAQWGKSLIKISSEIVWNLVKKWKVNARVACLPRNLGRIDLYKTNLSGSCHAQYRIHAQWGKSFIQITFEIVWNLVKKWKVNPLVVCLPRNLVQIDLCKTNLSGSYHQYLIHAQWGKLLIWILDCMKIPLQ